MTTALPHRYRVSRRRVETYDTVTLTLVPVDEALPPFEPGQFMMLTVFGVGEVPISISAAATADAPLTHTLRAVGAVTQALHDATPGTVLGVRGPFGRGWDLAAATGDDAVVVAGGCGLAPVWPVVQALVTNRAHYRRVSLLIGARTLEDLVFADMVWELCDRTDVHVEVTIDHPPSGWTGRTGVVTTLLDDALPEPERTEAYVCGPEVMIRSVSTSLVRAGIPADRIQVSLERNMRCGAGLCGHCQLGPLLLCRDGPVVTYDRTGALLAVKEL